MNVDALNKEGIAAQLLTGNNVGIWAFEMEPGQLPRMYANAEMERLLGIEGKHLPPEQVYHAWYDNINPAYCKLVDDSVAQMIDGHHAEVAYPWIHPVKGEIWVRCSGRRDEAYKKGVRLIGLHRDISDLIQFRTAGFRPEGGALASEFQARRSATASHAWQTSESLELWREIADTFPSMLFFKDADNDWRYCYSNARHHDFVGMDPTGKTDLENFGEESGKKWHEEDLRMFESGKPFNDNSTYYSFCEGDRFYNMRKYPLVTRSGHRYVIGIGTDITDIYLQQIRAKCLAAVQESLVSETDEDSFARRTFEAILRTVSWIPCIFYRDKETPSRSVCLRSDGKGRIYEPDEPEFCPSRSEPWQKYFDSLSAGEMRLCIDGATIDPGCRDAGLRACLSFSVMIEGRILGYATFFTNRRGPTEAYADMLMQLMNEVIAYAYRRWEARRVIEDLERQKEALQASRLAEAEASAKAKSLFLASMSHEIRTPLNAIIGLSQELQNDDISEQDRQAHLNSISTASRALLDLINDVLDISKLEAGHMALSAADTGLADLTRSCGSIFTDAAARRGLSFSVNAPSEAIVVKIDPHRVRQVLLNLLGNAIKFTQQGGVSLSCDFRATDTEVGRLRFEVTDTGVGISELDQSRIFGMFEQASGLRGTRVANSGTGLGLALCKRLAVAMKGDIDVVSELGKGSSFSLVLPNVPYRLRTDAELAEAKAHQEPTIITTPPKGKILVVDDVPLNLKVVSLMLKRAGIEYVTADCAVAALKVLEHEKVSAILTDLWMPDMSGEALAKHVRADPRFKDIAIAAVTADVDSDSTFDMTSFDAILAKPVTVSSLLDFLRHVK